MTSVPIITVARCADLSAAEFSPHTNASVIMSLQAYHCPDLKAVGSYGAVIDGQRRAADCDDGDGAASGANDGHDCRHDSSHDADAVSHVTGGSSSADALRQMARRGAIRSPGLRDFAQRQRPAKSQSSTEMLLSRLGYVVQTTAGDADGTVRAA